MFFTTPLNYRISNTHSVPNSTITFGTIYISTSHLENLIPILFTISPILLNILLKLVFEHWKLNREYKLLDSKYLCKFELCNSIVNDTTYAKLKSKFNLLDR